MSTGSRRFDAVIFDLDGTLLVDDHHMAVLETCDELARAHPEIDVGALEAANSVAWDEAWSALGDDWMLGKLPNSRMLSETVWSTALADLGIVDPAIVEEALQRHVQAEIRHLHLTEGAVELLDAAHAAGAKLAVITNGAVDVQTNKLRDTGILDRFDVVTTSGSAGVMKPDSRIFLLTLEALGVAAGRAVHIGDNLVNDVGGTKGAGLTAVWLNVNGNGGGQATEPVPDYDVRSLTVIPALLF